MNNCQMQITSSSTEPVTQGRSDAVSSAIDEGLLDFCVLSVFGPHTPGIVLALLELTSPELVLTYLTSSHLNLPNLPINKPVPAEEISRNLTITISPYLNLPDLN